MLAGLLYAGSGLGLTAWLGATRLLRGGGGAARAPLARREIPWLAGAVLVGGVAGPVLLMVGLGATDASVASLLLNLESVFTALIAWFVFRENFDRRIAVGMAFIVAGGVLLSIGPRAVTGFSMGVLAVAGACLAWAIDNNLTRKVSSGDAVSIAAIKGLVAGAVNIGLARAAGMRWPGIEQVAAAALIGLFGYGVSLALFIAALRDLGAARTGAYFSTAPFAGAALALALLGETPDRVFWAAAALMAAGVWLHVSERHEHLHEHEPLEHSHQHVHDGHHRHAHDFDWDGKEPHVHRHRHDRVVHSHPHYPDIHHRHPH
jgi:drug/metabolite transporter (DMT)-like permease